MMTENQFPGSDGKSTIRWYRTPMECPPSAVLQIVHGMSEYYLRYEGFAAYLADQGIFVAGHDQAGHGNSADPQAYGYFGVENGWRYLVEDVHRLRRIIRDEYKDIPYFILGHSMGSFVLREYLTCHGEGLSGAVITGTSGSNPMNRPGILLVRLLRKLYGDMHRSSFVHTMAFGGNNRKIGSPANLYAWLSSDQNVSDSYVRDPRCGFVFTLAGFQDLFTLLDRVSRKDWAGKVPQELPVLLASGLMDPVGNYGKGPAEVYERLKRSGHGQVALRLYEDMRHEILNEKGQKTVYSDIIDFIKDVSETDGSSGQ
ncbi:MAG: alpha/beta hydrolase [Anaerovoracaceae bacterium]